MTAQRTVILQVSRRSPRTEWNKPRSLVDVERILEANDFTARNIGSGVTYVRQCGLFRLRLTVFHGNASLELGQSVNGSMRWTLWPEMDRVQPWQAAREALEFLAVADVDTHVRWG